MSTATAPPRPTLNANRLAHALAAIHHQRYSLEVCPARDWPERRQQLERAREEWLGIPHQLGGGTAGIRNVVSVLSTAPHVPNVSLPLSSDRAGTWCLTMCRLRARHEVQASPLWARFLQVQQETPKT